MRVKTLVRFLMVFLPEAIALRLGFRLQMNRSATACHTLNVFGAVAA